MNIWACLRKHLHKHLINFISKSGSHQTPCFWAWSDHCGLAPASLCSRLSAELIQGLQWQSQSRVLRTEVLGTRHSGARCLLWAPGPSAGFPGTAAHKSNYAVRSPAGVSNSATETAPAPSPLFRSISERWGVQGLVNACQSDDCVCICTRDAPQPPGTIPTAVLFILQKKILYPQWKH